MEELVMVELIPVNVLDRIVQETLSPKLAHRGFEQIDRRRWMRSEKRSIREVIRLTSMKGVRLSPSWGFSLDFVPHISAGRLRWHKTLKSTVLDLSYDPYDYEDKIFTISRFASADAVRNAALDLLADVLTRSSEFFDSVRTVADLPRSVEAKRNRPFVRFGFLNYVQEPMAYAFVLAKLGNLDDARKWFEVAKRYHQLDKIELDKLEVAFRTAQKVTHQETGR
jgi:hypothetical protein